MSKQMNTELQKNSHISQLITQLNHGRNNPEMAKYLRRQMDQLLSHDTDSAPKLDH